ncbi:c-type cytochrome biogenesis protein CcmI [Aquisalinus flavus]|uniref:C-type cytochrome biogenesis protein CcmI n=1 Tax=Aquisalinus flavus TaxID=1526572 RepID=A0A8J2Y5P7_9PROT|nr:c-type cytochrome biogenesis protein CcmI [Aquisalinus flavus]MBD0427363.1 c-type cytochrome biogenesis protein CcmI [Aquisalinus flavus]UNE47168.1 c-type cytochrome biogenesis protein CcmI [Aquisalinus flavus]GGD00437.1 hypothetical protein GCM10011342_06780 [Aquisalinus flavus]
MLFVLIAITLTLATVGVLALALWRRQGKPTAPAHEIAIYKDQLAEIERDRARGVITAGEESAARLEVERRLIAAGRQSRSRPGGTSRPVALVSVVMIGLMPLAAGLLYLQYGEPGLTETRDSMADAREILATITAEPGKTRPVIRRLTQELQTDLNNPAKWLVLGRSLYASGRKEDAIPAYETAVQLTRGENAAIFAEYTQVLLESLDERLARDPEDVAALRQLADIRMTLGEIDAAQTAYERVLQLDPADQQARTALGIDAFSARN